MWVAEAYGYAVFPSVAKGGIGIGKARDAFTASITYEEDIDRSYNSIYAMLEENERVLETLEPYVFVSKLADSGVDITIFAWTRTEDWWPLTTELPRLVRKPFDREDIEIPYPHVEVVTSKARASHDAEA